MSDSASASIFRILLVEDAPEQSLLLSALLQKLGPFEVVLSQDGVQALERARNGTFDLVLTDLNLPGMDGFELTRQLKAALPTLPVVATTGYTDPTYVEGAYRAGVDVLMSKPVNLDDLEARLRELLPRWRSEGDRHIAVVAVGARPEDVYMGCGASLAAHQAAGHDVVICVVTAGDEGEAARAHKAADRLGVRLLSADTAAPAEGREAARSLIERLVADLHPAWGYLPSGAEGDDARRRVQAVAREALAAVPTVLAYPTPTASLTFSPTVYRDVTPWMGTKLEALTHLSAADSRGAHSPQFARAQARYWGRFKNFVDVEPFELVERGARSAAETASAPDVPPEGRRLSPPVIPPGRPAAHP